VEGGARCRRCCRGPRRPVAADAGAWGGGGNEVTCSWRSWRRNWRARLATLAVQFRTWRNAGGSRQARTVDGRQWWLRCERRQKRLPDCRCWREASPWGGRMTSAGRGTAPRWRRARVGILWISLHLPSSRDETSGPSGECHQAMLFLQGTRDELADLKVVASNLREAGPSATVARY